MQRTGYRQSFQNGNWFNIKSEVKQFQFCLEHKHLIVLLDWSTKQQLAPIERVDIYLKDRVLLSNCFIVNGNLFYYYERDWYDSDDPRADAPVPHLNILIRFKFTIDDIVFIQANNTPTLAKFSWLQKKMETDSDSMDNLKNIRQNIFVKEEEWTALPKIDSDTLYHL